MKAFLLLALLIVATSARSLKQGGIDPPVIDPVDQTQDAEVQPAVTEEPVVTEEQPVVTEDQPGDGNQPVETQPINAWVAEALPIEAQQPEVDALLLPNAVQETTRATKTEDTNAGAGSSSSIDCGDCQVYVEGGSPPCQLAPVGTACAEGQGQCLAGGACMVDGISSESVTPSPPAEEASPSPPAEDTPSPPAEDTPSPPAEDTPSPPAEDTPSPPAEDTPSPPAEDTPSPPAEDTPSPPAEDAPALVPSPEIPVTPELPVNPEVVASPPAATPAVPDNVLCSNSNLLGGFSPVLPSKLPEESADLVFQKFLAQNYTYNDKKYKGCANYTAEVAVACQQVVSQAKKYKVMVAATCIDTAGAWNNGVELVWIEGALTDSPAKNTSEATSALLRAAVLKPKAKWNYEEDTTCPGPITGAPGSWEPLDVRSDGELDPLQVAVFESTYAAVAETNCTSTVLSDREACWQLVAGRNVYNAFNIKCVEGDVTGPSDTARVEAQAFVGLDGTIDLKPLNITLL